MTVVRRLLRLLTSLLLLAGISTCSGQARITPRPSPSEPSASAPLRYIAIGDSYTIGTSVEEAERWPNQLVASLTPPRGESPLALVANLAVNGWTSRDVLDRQVPRLQDLRPDFVSLLVGVNDVVRGIPHETFRANAAEILDRLLARLPADRIVVVATPDYTVTPQGASYGDPAEQRAGIVQNNAALQALAEARRIAFVDIFDLSLRAETDRGLVAGDGLHPSGAQYALWVERIVAVVATLLE